VGALPDRPVVYAAMGTASNRVPGVLEAIREGLRKEPITLIMTTSRYRDPASFGPRPTHVRVERYVPQSLLFPRCDLMVTYGGTGTNMTALGHGLTMVLIPIAADRPDNARRCEAFRGAQVIACEGRTPGPSGRRCEQCRGTRATAAALSRWRTRRRGCPDPSA
jgi:UDP:flavonoid glycosyltransferase YjiC (YdhE family)